MWFSNNIWLFESNLKPEILAVDDVNFILELYKDAIPKLWFNVDCAESWEECLEKYSQNPLKYDIILLDLGLPDIQWDEVVEQILKINSSANIILSTGALVDSIDAKTVLSVKWVIEKPFTLKNLKILVENIVWENN